MTTTGLQLDVSEMRPSQIDLTPIQDTLAELDIGIWPLYLTSVPDEFRALIRQRSLSNEE